MAFGEAIDRGISYLLRLRNADGGIPSADPKSLSGCWTTAEALEIFLATPYYPKNRMGELNGLVEFLLVTRLQDSGWPITVTHRSASAMATGHCVAALRDAVHLLDLPTDLACRVALAADEGLEWLRSQQNPDGGWGVEPGEPTGSDSRMIATAYVLRGFSKSGYTLENSKNVRDAVNFLRSMQRQDGSWSSAPAVQNGDTSSTGRALVTLKLCGEPRTSKAVRKGLKYIHSQRRRFRKTGVEVYLPHGGHGQTVFNFNTPYDVLEALVLWDDSRVPTVQSLAEYFLSKQEDNGSWFISPGQGDTQPVCTWTTSEALIALHLSEWYFQAHVYSRDRRQYRAWRMVAVPAILLAILQALYIAQLQGWIPAIPKEVMNLVLVTVMLGVIVSIIGNLVTPWVREVWARFQGES